MPTNINSPSGPALLANEPHLQDVTLPVIDEGDIAVVSPQSNVDSDAALIHRENRTTIAPKIVLKNDLISDDVTKHSSSGHDVMLIFLKILDTRGYNECMGHGKKQAFISKINTQLHADDGPLVMFKLTSDSSFLKKITKALKVLDRHLNVSHSSGPGEDGEEYPPHLKQLLNFYEKIMKSANDSKCKTTQSEKNLVIQNEFLGNIVPPADRSSEKPRHSSRSRNLKEGHIVVERGDNSHNASGKEIVILEERPVLKKKTTPNTVALLQDAQSAKMDFSVVFEQLNNNSNKRELRVSRENSDKLNQRATLIKMKRRAQESRINLASIRVTDNSKQKRIVNLCKMIEMVRGEIVVTKDMPDLRAEATARLRKYYTELEFLNSSL